MEPQSENITPPQPQPTLDDPFARALKEIEDRLTQKMKEMIDPLMTSLNWLVAQQKDWHQQWADMKDLQVEKTKMTQKMGTLSEKND